MFYWSMGEILDNDSELKEMERISLQAPELSIPRSKNI